MTDLHSSRKTHFVSGHLTLTEAEFDQHYRPTLDCAIDSDDDIAWVRPGRQQSGTQKTLDRRHTQTSA